MVGVGGLFGYHALYFLALRFAPPAEAGLLNYLWPLLIVLFSSLLPGERLAPHHVIGALLGLAGTVLLFAGNSSGGFAPGQLPGLDRGLRRRLRLGGLFGDVAPAEIGADRCGGGFLPRDRAACGAWCMPWSRSRSGRRRTAQWLAIAALGIGSGGRGVLCLGHRHEARRYPRAGCCILCDAAALDRVSDSGGICASRARTSRSPRS